MTKEIGRRQFLRESSIAGVLAATAATAATAVPVARALGQQLPPNESGAGDEQAFANSDGTYADVADRQLDSREFCLSVYDGIRPGLTFSATDAATARSWQAAAKQRLVLRLGGFPVERVPLAPEIIERRDFGSYTRERVVMQTQKHLSAIGYFLIPKRSNGPLPALICLPGHGRGVNDILGLDDEGSPSGQRGVGYAKEYAQQCVEHGYAVFALEQLAFGARRDAPARAKGPAENSCRPAACAALLFGQTMLGWRVWDAMRAIDYVQSRPEVDPRRIATLGASSGGTTALFTAALDERVRAAVVSAYFNTFRDSIVSLSHCPDNYVPGLLHDMELYDIAGLVAPRPLFVESGARDPIFPIAGSRTAAGKAQQMYATFGVPDGFVYDVHDGAHEFSGRRAWRFLERAI